jgi:four helix bundle protein
LRRIVEARFEIRGSSIVNQIDHMAALEKGNRHSVFEDLEVYQVAREFRKALYRVARRLPDIEKFALANQIRRAAVSLTNNIAEAHGRYHYLDQIKFLRQSRGSLQELIDDLNVCMDEQYLPVNEITSLKEEGWRVRELIDGYVRYLRDQKNSTGTASYE